MQNNDLLSQNLDSKAMGIARLMHLTDSSFDQIDGSFLMEIENGEGIAGYQYLHGTNGNVGGFESSGTGTMLQSQDGSYTVFLVM